MQKKRQWPIVVPLFQQAGVGNIFPYLLYPIVSTQIMPNFQNFVGHPFFLFSYISNSLTSSIWRLVSWWVTWLYHRKWLCTNIFFIFTATPTFSLRTALESPLTSRTPHILTIKRFTYVASNHLLPNLTTSQKNSSDTTLIYFTRLLKR